MCPLPISAVSITAIPVFFRNKRWVGLRDGKVSCRREIVPFWVFTVAGLLLSTVLVALANRVSDSTLLVMAANLGGFGVLLVSKFLFLDQIMFGHSEREEVLAQDPSVAVDPA